MSAKHSYQIDINGGSKKGTSLSYNFGGTKNIQIILGKNRASVHFGMSVLKEPEDFSLLRFGLFRDCLRKVYLLHALYNQKGLVISNISISIDEDSFEFSSTTDGFPFVWSMLEGNNIELPSAWRSDDVIAKVLSWTKTSSDNDYLSCATNAFLLAQCRRYRIDRFQNLWTSLNALYNNNAARLEKAKCEKSAVGHDKPKDFKILKRDIDRLGAIAVFEPGIVVFPDGLRTDPCKRAYRHTSEALAKIAPNDIPQFYQIAKTSSPEELQGKYPEIGAIARSIDLPVYHYLIFAYPYHLRCDIFHGSKAINIFSGSNDPEISDLAVVNYFLDHYLAEKIPPAFGLSELMSPGEVAVVDQFLRLRNKKRKNFPTD